MTPDERGAIRAYLQRTEVRLSTVHRVASALLSGAGLMVLFPALERDSITSVIRSLFTGEIGLARALLIASVCVAVILPFITLWLVLRDLTQFYFHSNHVRSGAVEAFTPRFTLTGLRFPSDELSPSAADELERSRREGRAVELLVPANEASRQRIDRQLNAYGGLGLPEAPTDLDRASALFELAASQPRGLYDEVAKVEHGMARHVLRIQVIVLRYVKAVLAMLTTAVAAFALAGVAEHSPQLGPGELLWLALILMAWAPAVMYAVTTPVRWLERQLRSEGAGTSAVADDRELTRVEDVTVRVAMGGFLVASVAMLVVITDGDISAGARTAAIVIATVAVAAVALVLATWTGGHRWQRLLRRDLSETARHLREASARGRRGDSSR